MRHPASVQGKARMRWAAVAAGIAAPMLVALAACGAGVAPRAATPTTAAAELSERASEGEAKFLVTGCAACHGDRGEGGIGPRSSGTQIRLVDLQLLVRSGQMDGVRYASDELSDQDVANIYLWLRTNPAGDLPTPESAARAD